MPIFSVARIYSEQIYFEHFTWFATSLGENNDLFGYVYFYDEDRLPVSVSVCSIAFTPFSRYLDLKLCRYTFYIKFYKRSMNLSFWGEIAISFQIITSFVIHPGKISMGSKKLRKLFKFEKTNVSKESMTFYSLCAVRHRRERRGDDRWILLCRRGGWLRSLDVLCRNHLHLVGGRLNRHQGCLLLLLDRNGSLRLWLLLLLAVVGQHHHHLFSVPWSHPRIRLVGADVRPLNRIRCIIRSRSERSRCWLRVRNWHLHRPLDGNHERLMRRQTDERRRRYSCHLQCWRRNSRRHRRATTSTPNVKQKSSGSRLYIDSRKDAGEQGPVWVAAGSFCLQQTIQPV